MGTKGFTCLGTVYEIESGSMVADALGFLSTSFGVLWPSKLLAFEDFVHGMQPGLGGP